MIWDHRKKIIFTKHAKLRMKEHGVTEDEIYLKAPYAKIVPKDEQRAANKMYKHGRYVDEWWVDGIYIVSTIDKDKYIIITMYKQH